MIVDYIDAHRDRFGVDPICAVLSEHGLQIAPSTYYAAKARGPVSDTDWADAHAANTVHQLFVANRRLYGVRKLWHAMKHAGHNVGLGKDHTLFATATGQVKFEVKGPDNRKFVSIVPAA